MKKITILLLSLACLSAYPFAEDVAYAAPRRTSEDATSAFGFAFGYMSGNSTYHISSYDPTGTSGIESELEFPLNTFLVGLETGTGTKDRRGRDIFRLDFTGLWTLGNGSGKMKDSDWGTDDIDIATVGSAHPGKDIYSESDISLKGSIFDLRATYNVWAGSGFSIGPLGGYRYEHFDYTVSNLNQVGYGPYAAAYTGSISGKVLVYEVTYNIPYLGVHSGIVFGKSFQSSVDLGYSPSAVAKDQDDHILRTKLAKGDADGKAFLATVTARWDIEDNDFFTVRGQYLKITTTGTQTQTWYATTPGEPPAGTTISGIPDKITSKQLSVDLLVTHRF